MTFVYILKCKDNTLYCGYTTDLIRRIKEHNLNYGAKYTRGRTPVKLIYYEIFDTKSQAMKREIEIKKMRKKEKEQLIANFDKQKILKLKGGDFDV